MQMMIMACHGLNGDVQWTLTEQDRSLLSNKYHFGVIIMELCTKKRYCTGRAIGSIRMFLLLRWWVHCFYALLIKMDGQKVYLQRLVMPPHQ